MTAIILVALRTQGQFQWSAKIFVQIVEDTGRDTSLLYGQQNEIKAAGKDREVTNFGL